MTPRFLDWIWHVRGSLALAPGQTGDDALDRLDPLFREAGTSRERTGGTLTFRKRDQAAQDRMAVFDGGVLSIEGDAAGSVLRYRLTSRALLFCFLAPLLFLGFAQLTILSGKLQSAEPEKAKSEKAKQPLPMNPIDRFLGAPAPEKPDKKKDKKDDDKPSPTAAYVFAGIFAALYLIGRFLEARMVRTLFRKHLLNS